MNVSHLLGTYSDGDETGWQEEFAYLYANRAERLNELRPLIAEHGIQRPILLGNDGRVWDGHHRLCLAVELGIEDVPVTHA